MSLWFGVLLVPLMAVLGRRVGGRWMGLGAALGAAVLPFLLGEAQEIADLHNHAGVAGVRGAGIT